MHLHEYQAKFLLREHGVPIPDFIVVSNIKKAEEAIEAMNLEEAVIKIQVHAGGRGKAGGVKIAKGRKNLLDTVRQLLGMRLTNSQTSKEGVIAKEVLISPVIHFNKEYYLSVTIDRKSAQAILMVSAEGGMEIEEIAAKTPEKIKIVSLPTTGTLCGYQWTNIADFLGWTDQIAAQGKSLVHGLIKAFSTLDALLIEINPLVLTTEGQLLALDAKITLDDNALFRQKELTRLEDLSQVPTHEARAKEHDLAYVALDGEIGCMVNGAGLAMATMDIIKYYGGNPANFLDVGGGASQEKIAEGFKIILSDPKVKVILINIFGGIMNCVTLATGIISATANMQVHVPLIVRMEGTQVEIGKKLLEDSRLDIILTKDLADAAQKAVAASYSL